MTHWIALTPKTHLQAGWTRFTRYDHAANDAVVPILAAELTELLPYYALAFCQNPSVSDTQYQMVALLSLQSGLNLFLDNQNQWQAPYVPAHYRSYPFGVFPDQKGNLALCYDAESGLISNPATADQLPMLTSNGKPSEYLAPIIDFLNQKNEQIRLTQALVDQLTVAGVIEAWELNSQGKDGKVKPVKGLFHISETNLKALPADKLSELAQSGSLTLAYSQLLSQSRLKDFTARFETHVANKNTEVDIESLFGEQDDTLKFNF